MSRQRDRLLASVSDALKDARERARPLPEVVALEEGCEDPHVLAARFCEELRALAGFATIVHDAAACSAAVSEYLSSRAVRSVAVQSAPLAKRVGTGLAGLCVAQAVAQDKAALERCDASLLEASSLLADTGAAIVVLGNSQDRVLPYLPRTCVIVAPMSALHSTMSLASYGCIREALDSTVAGEALIVAGPSRSADIEKTLVLGAHGPQALAVFLIEEPA